MKEILKDIAAWEESGVEEFALATVIRTWGSSPRQVGAKMAVTANGRFSGSVSGGCVEGAVIEACRNTLASGDPQNLHFGVADETAWDVGLACGGEVDIFVERLDATWLRLYRQFVDEDWTGAVITVVRGPDDLLGYKFAINSERERVDAPGQEPAIEAAASLATLASSTLVTHEGGLEIFVDIFQPAPLLVMVGGVHIAIALAPLAKAAGYRTAVIDPRRSFGSKSRFADVDRLIQRWPKQAFAEIRPSPTMAVALLTHDPKIDDQALEILLKSDAFYIGALGSRRTHAKRKERLRALGFDDSQIGRIHAPIGLDIGARSPEEIALSIMAEVVAVRRGAHPADKR